MKKYGLKLWSINDYYAKEAQRLYDEGFYDYIELYAVPESFENYVKCWKNLGIPFIIHAPHFAHGMNLSKSECFNNNIKLSQETLKFADTLDSKQIIFHGGVDGCHIETARQLKKINDSRILIENKPYKAIPEMNGTFCIGSKLKEIQEIIEISNCAFCLDIGHAIAASNTFKVKPFDYIKQFLELGPQIYHLSDTNIHSEVDSHLNFGNGNLDLKNIYKLLPGDAIITIETNKKSKSNLNAFIKDMKYLREIFL